MKLSGFKLKKFLLNDPYTAFIIFYSVFTFAVQFAFLNMSPYASGTDGYYYAYQLKTMHERGVFAAPESSLSLYFLYILSFAVKNIVLSNKIASSLLKALFAAGIYLAVSNLKDRKTGAAAAVISTSFTLINFFTCEYLKALGGTVIFVFFINSLVVLYRKRTCLNYSAAGLLFLFSLMSHRVIAVFSLILFVFFILFFTGLRNALIAALGVFLLMIILSVFFPNFLNSLDLHRLRDYFSPSPLFSLTAFTRRINAGPVEAAGISLLFLSPFPVFAIMLKKREQYMFIYAALFIIFLICINPFTVFDSSDAAFRLFLFMFIPASVFMSIPAGLIKPKYLAVLLLMMLSVHIYSAYTAYRLHSHNYELYHDIIPLLELPENSLLIVHQGFDYMYWYETGLKAFHFLPEEKHMNRPLYRLAFGVRKDLFEKYAPENSEIRYLPGFYTLLSENDWNAFMRNVPGEMKDSFLTWKNPHEYREDFLLRNQKFRKKK